MRRELLESASRPPPPSYVTMFRCGGIDVVNDAKNHAFDFGQRGTPTPGAAIRKAGMRSTGGRRT